MTAESTMEKELVLRAIRLAEKAHRTRSRGPHFRKAPQGEDRPFYLVHLAEVAWMLNDAGCADELVAAAYLHDVLEDCDYSADQLEAELGDRDVRLLVEAVTELDRDPQHPERKVSWELRNANYLARMALASIGVLSLSCADKTANLMDMCQFLAQGYATTDFTSRDYATNLRKYRELETAYQGRVPDRLFLRYRHWLTIFEGFRR